MNNLEAARTENFALRARVEDLIADNKRLRGLLARVVPRLDRGMESLHADIAAALGRRGADPVIHAIHDETGSPWNGRRSKLPPGYSEACTDEDYAAQQQK